MKTFRLINCTILAFLFSSPFLSAQTGPSNELPQFLFQKFSRGVVKMKAGNSYGALLNYNKIDEEMIFEQKGTYLIFENIKDIDTIFVQNRIFVPVEKAFYEVVARGKYPVYIQHKSKYAPVATTSAYGIKSQTQSTVNVTTVKAGQMTRTLDVPPDVTVSDYPVNWVMKDGVMEKFSNTGNLVKLFPEKESGIKDFIKKEKINFKEYNDVVKLAKFINQ